MNESTNSIQVLHVDDDPRFVELVATVLEDKHEQFVIETATSASEALIHLESTDVDCIVSDYEMPGQNGIALLKAVRKDCPDLPFILLTGKGSEAVASDAMTAGVTDYLRKDSTTNHYTELANRITTAVDSVAAQRERRHHLDAIETAHEAIGILDEGEFSYVNKAFADLYGYDSAAMIGEEWELIYPAEEVVEIRSEALPTVTETGRWHGQTVGRRADGSTFSADQTISMTDGGKRVCTVRDLTGREDRESRLERNMLRLELAIDGANLGVWDWNMQTDEVQFNDKWAEMIGYTVEEIESHLDAWETRVHPDDLDAVEAALQAHIDGETPYYDTEHRMRTADDNWLWIRDIGTIVERDKTGDPVRAIGIHLDIDDRKQREQELEQEKQRLEEFTRIVSHDLRNPLQVAAGNVELAGDVCDSEYLDAADDALNRIEELLDALLRLAQSGDHVTETTLELGSVVDDCWQNVETAAATLVNATDQTVRADRSQLSQLFENLFRNAVEHGGTDVTVTIGTLADGFYVEDDGPGIPAAEQDDVFAAGHSTTAEGTGFGLSIVNQVVQAHGWTIRVTDGAEDGARFEITGVDTVAP